MENLRIDTYDKDGILKHTGEPIPKLSGEGMSDYISRVAKEAGKLKENNPDYEYRVMS